MKNAIYILLATAIFAGCKPENPPKPADPVDDSVSLTFKFQPRFNDMEISWPMFNVTDAGDTMRFERVKYILSNFILEKTTGEMVKLDNAYGFISLKDKLDSFILTGVPKGDYKSLRFMVGLDSVINHGNPQQWSINHPLNPSVNDMHWGWSGGYIFQVVEGYYKNKGFEKAFSFHVALDKQVKRHTLVYNYSIQKNARFSIAVNIDKFFSNAINFSLKSDGDFSHSGDPDPVMDKFFSNAGGTMDITDFK